MTAFQLVQIVLLSTICSFSFAWLSAVVPPTRTTNTRLYSSPTSEYSLDNQVIRGPVTPLGNLIMVRVKDTLSATAGGILLPDQSKERPTEGVVVAAGPGKWHPFTAKRIDNPIPEGVSVLYGKFDGRAVNYNGDECQMIRDDDVLLYYTGVMMKLETVVPVRDYVLIELALQDDEASRQTKSGIVLAGQVLQNQVPCQGTVIKVGEGRMASEGSLTQSPVKVGDFCKFKDYAGNDVRIEGKEYSIVKMVDILCTLDKSKSAVSEA